MNTDIFGRIKNTNLPVSKPLIPLFEAVSNSIHSIEDNSNDDGIIKINIIRDTDLFDKKDETNENIGDILSFQIIDNGIGFDDENYIAFLTADTTHKASRGGKGIGRFSWLVAFESVEVESYYKNNGNFYLRKFSFKNIENGVENHETTDTNKRDIWTKIVLENFKDPYKKSCPKHLNIIATLLIEEFLDIFLGPSCPKISIIDDKELINLNDLFEKEIYKNSTRDKFDIKGNNFQILHIKLYSSHIINHKYNLCANHRVVTSEKLTGVPNIPRKLKDQDENEFVYSVYVYSSYLDDAVTSDRTGFKLDENKIELFPNLFSLSEIRQSVITKCIEFLKPYLEPIIKQKKELIRNFIETDGVMYRPIANKLGDVLDKIMPDATSNEIDLALYKELQSFQLSLKTDGNKLINDSSLQNLDFENYKNQFIDYFERISELSKVELARYVFNRKVIIEFLKRQLSSRDDGKYPLEDRVHSIIFPRGKTSNDIFFEDHNLWLIDERLAFHVFLASDKKFNEIAVLDNSSNKRPDIIIFDRAVAFSDGDLSSYTSITLLEFKRPQRNDYTDRENPFSQIFQYCDLIKDGKAKLQDGRSLVIVEGLPFYCYIICDMTPNLITWSKNSGLQKTPDGLGFFGYNNNYKAYIEVISYQKIVSDAEKRNRAFFEKLGFQNKLS